MTSYIQLKGDDIMTMVMMITMICFTFLPDNVPSCMQLKGGGGGCGGDGGGDGGGGDGDDTDDDEVDYD